MSLVRRSLVEAAAASAPGVALEQPRLEAGGNGVHSERGMKRSRAVASSTPVLAQRVVTVDFNAWQYEDSTQIWAGLACRSTSAIEAALPRWRRLVTPFEYAWKNHRADLIFQLVLPALVAVLVLALAALGVPLLQQWLNDRLASETAARLLGGVLPAVAAVIAAFWAIAARTHRFVRPISERVRSYTQQPDYLDRMGYQHQVIDDLKFVIWRLRGDKPDPRIVVFIDDLDRCSDEKIVEILQAINVVLGESECYVFLGIDARMIHRAIEAHYAGVGRPLDPDFADTYLEKIVQLQFHLPASSRAQRKTFVASLFSDATRRGTSEDGKDEATEVTAAQWNRDKLRSPETHIPKPVPDTPLELEAFLEFQNYLDDNPREIKRLVNVHRFVKIVLQKEGRPPPEDMQRKLVIWLVFCVRWPDLYEKVLAHARDIPQSGNCIAEALAVDDVNLKAFADRAGPDDVLTAGDLAPEGPLALAASISQSVRWKSVPASPGDDAAHSAAQAAMQAADLGDQLGPSSDWRSNEL